MVELGISRAAYEEIAAKFRAAGYDHVFMPDGTMDMSGIGVTVDPQAARPPGFVKPDTDRQVFFYEQDFYVLSNFSAFNLTRNGWTFPTSEHAYHYEKFDRGTRALGDGVYVRDAILDASSAHEAFKIAERYKAMRRRDWDDVKVDIMRDILRIKAAQHEYVRRKLLAIGMGANWRRRDGRLWPVPRSPKTTLQAAASIAGGHDG